MPRIVLLLLVKPNDFTSNSTTRSVRRPRHEPQFIKVLDGRKQPMRGLWVRNGRFYAQLKVDARFDRLYLTATRNLALQTWIVPRGRGWSPQRGLVS